ncbi:hypothetical protein SLS60_009457 [Paraconiothyrium brasiliense]|uniref:Uncharacterized protein n=1 Tax=Paraconiothyrium brasiliense TaxID=300254 RepID=A0ABR3QUN1_9PLEO
MYQPRQSQEQSVDRAQPSSEPEFEQASRENATQTKVKSRAVLLWEKEKRRRKREKKKERKKEQIRSEEAAPTNAPSCVAISHKKGKQERSSTEEQILKHSENAEKQRLQNEEKKRLKKQKKRQKRKERIDRPIKELQEQPFEFTKDHTNMREGATHGSPEPNVFADSHKPPDHAKETNEGAKYDPAVKFGWVNSRNDIPEPIQDDFIDSAFEDDHQVQSKKVKSRPEDSNALKEPLSRPRQSTAHEKRPRTPTRSPPIQEPVTPTRLVRTPDVLVVTPSRRLPSPQLEYIVSPKSPAVVQAAANMLVTLKSRTARLNEQIAAFNTHLLSLQDRQPSPSKMKLDQDSMAKAKLLGKILRVMEKHSNQVFMMEFALRDLVDEGDEDLPNSLRMIELEFAELVKTHEAKMNKVMRKLCPEAMEMTLKEADDGLDKNM